MLRWPAPALLGLFAMLWVGGCAPLRRGGGSPLAPLELAANGAWLEVLFVRLPPATPDEAAALWNDVDEQQLAVQTRQRLEANGFRVGLITTRLPPLLEQLLDQPRAPARDNGEQLLDVTKEPTVRGWKRQVHEGQPREIDLAQTGPRAQMPVLIREDGGEVTGEVFHQAKPTFVEKAYPQPDGRVRIELLPEIVYGEAQRQFLPGDNGALQIQFRPPRKAYDRLKIDATLGLGQMLIVGGRPEREGSLGAQYFTEPGPDGPRQQLLLVRLAQANPDAVLERTTAEQE